ncbi:hypothetical protein SFR_5630 [Streptomyces sp. FR-008]|nr:hypothetical protein SFR_5630 [Streptomyces sp. FR-008]
MAVPGRVHRGCHRGAPPTDCCIPSEGRRPCGPPRYHPPWPAPSPGRRRPLIGGAMPVLLTRSGLSSGGSGVIFTSGGPPGFHRPRVAHGR